MDYYASVRESFLYFSRGWKNIFVSCWTANERRPKLKMKIVVVIILTPLFSQLTCSKLLSWSYQPTYDTRWCRLSIQKNLFGRQSMKMKRMPSEIKSREILNRFFFRLVAFRVYLTLLFFEIPPIRWFLNHLTFDNKFSIFYCTHWVFVIFWFLWWFSSSREPSSAFILKIKLLQDWNERRMMTLEIFSAQFSGKRNFGSESFRGFNYFSFAFLDDGDVEMMRMLQ